MWSSSCESCSSESPNKPRRYEYDDYGNKGKETLTRYAEDGSNVTVVTYFQTDGTSIASVSLTVNTIDASGQTTTISYPPLSAKEITMEYEASNGALLTTIRFCYENNFCLDQEATTITIAKDTIVITP